MRTEPEARRCPGFDGWMRGCGAIQTREKGKAKFQGRRYKDGVVAF